MDQVRFEGQLYLALDTPFASFRLPPMTLQPIVENAVRRGPDPNLEPLHISISTKSEEAAIRITVEDNGPGYDPSADSEPLAALENLRERLRSMYSGTLEIAPRKALGTRVMIFDPPAFAMWLPTRFPIEPPSGSCFCLTRSCRSWINLTIENMILDLIVAAFSASRV